ncbi:hypothetical protein [Hyalangium sp.]|uniref:hypothetical protein n=1 Tax=Hyalangium sp. TaxID=2028555 RepID=UPI003899BA0A
MLALPFVVLCAVVYLSSAAHFALVEHGTCLEHGEVIHLGELREEAPSRPPEASVSNEHIIWESQAISDDGDEDHCTVAFLRREGPVCPAWSLLVLEIAAEAGPVPALEQVHPEPVARLRLAPKASPPVS